MLDIRFIRENPELVKEKSQQKNIKVDIDKLLEADKQRLDLLQQVELLRQKRNENADKMKDGKPDENLINEGKQVKVELAERTELLESMNKEVDSFLALVPNLHSDDVPIGGEDANVEVGKFGDTPTGAKDHLEICEQNDWVDFDRGAKVAGSKFYYLKGDLAMLENALHQYALKVVRDKGFLYMTVPHMVNSRVATGTGFAPRSQEHEDEYFIEGEDLTLIATAEVSLTGYHADEIIDEKDLPKLYAGYSPSYRKEAGTYGKHTRGLFRVHQFNKVEMYAFTLPEKSIEMHENLRAIEEDIWKAIGIPYRVVNIASAELGAPAVKKYDIEYWSPVDGVYREISSCSNCTDFQARNLDIRVRRNDGKIEPLHTLNGTAISMARTLVAIIENFQTSEGRVNIPEVLKPYMGGAEQI